MRIIISPAKQMRVDTDSFACKELPVFMDRTEVLMKWIQSVFCKHFLEKVADKNGECCISKTEIVAGTFQTEDFRLLKHAGIHR